MIILDQFDWNSTNFNLSLKFTPRYLIQLTLFKGKHSQKWFTYYIFTIIRVYTHRIIYYDNMDYSWY